MKYFKITRSDYDGYYIQPISDIASAIDAEIVDAEAGLKITLEIIEMPESQYEKLPEFVGW